MKPAAGFLPLLFLLPTLPVPVASGAERLLRDPLGFLRGEGRLSDADLGNLQRGGVLVKVIETDDRSEILTFAAVKVKTTPTRVLERLRDMEDRREEPWTLQSGRVGETPSANDFAALALDRGDVKDLAKCRVNACDVRLPADEIEKFRREVGGAAPANQEARANALFHDMLERYVASYRARGNAALFEYVNNDDPVRIGDSLKLLIPRSWLLREAAPDVWGFLTEFPAGRPADAEDFIYWAKEKFWLLDVLSLNHVTIVDRPTPAGRLIVAASKQLYANHYYESSLGLTLFVESSDSGSYLVLVNRTRADIRRNGFTWIERLLLNHLVRHRLEARVKRLRLRLQST